MTGVWCPPPTPQRYMAGAFEGSLSPCRRRQRRIAWRVTCRGADAAALGAGSGRPGALAGTTNIFVDVTTAGATRGELRSGLAGLARVRLKGGTLHGFDMLAALREWRPGDPGPPDGHPPPRPGETSALGELTAGFAIDRGVGRSVDLQAQGGPFAISGGGSVDLAARKIDLLTRVSLAAPPAGPEGGCAGRVCKRRRAAGAGARPFGQAGWSLEPGAGRRRWPARTVTAPARPEAGGPAPKPAPTPAARSGCPAGCARRRRRSSGRAAPVPLAW